MRINDATNRMLLHSGEKRVPDLSKGFIFVPCNGFHCFVRVSVHSLHFALHIYEYYMRYAVHDGRNTVPKGEQRPHFQKGGAEKRMQIKGRHNHHHHASAIKEVWHEERAREREPRKINVQK